MLNITLVDKIKLCLSSKVINVCLWILSKLSDGIFIEPIRVYSLRTRELMKLENSVDSGEYKRHRVLSRLIKDFPDVPVHKLALEIELIKSGGSV